MPAAVTNPAPSTRANPFVLLVPAAFASWTIGYWIALAVGRGWGVALPIAAGVATILGLLWRSSSAGSAETTMDHRDIGPLAVVLAVTVGYSLVDSVPRSTLLAVVGGLLALRLLAFARDREPADAALFFVLGLGLVAGLVAQASWTGWTLIAVVIAAIVLFAPNRISEWLPSALAGRPDTGRPTIDRGRAAVANLLLAGFGMILAIWHLGPRFWNEDNTYYFNKAVNYARSPGAFDTDDVMFGVDGVVHVPFGNLLSAYEPALGLLARLFGLRVDTMANVVLVPLIFFSAPFIFRFVARRLGVRDANLAAGIAAAAAILMGQLWTSRSFASASLGKSIGQFVGIALLIGVLARFARSPDRRSLLETHVVMIALVGLSPSLGLAALCIVAAFCGAAVHQMLRAGDRQPRWPAIRKASLPVVSMVAFVLFAKLFQDSAGEAQFVGGFFTYTDGRDALRGLLVDNATAMTFALAFGSLLLAAVILPRGEHRGAFALVLVGVFGIIFSPWTFDLVTDDVLDVAVLADRIFWLVQVPIMVGIVVALIDTNRRGRYLTVVALTLLLAIAGPTPAGARLFFRSGPTEVLAEPLAWPWELDDTSILVATLIENTPEGGVFFGAATVESEATASEIAIEAGKRPTYARVQYVETIAADPSTPADFHAADRVALGSAMEGSAEHEVDELRTALENVAPDTACIGSSASEALRAAIAESYVSQGNVGGVPAPPEFGLPAGTLILGCDLWVRSAGQN